jgi:hypothetical protein
MSAASSSSSVTPVLPMGVRQRYELSRVRGVGQDFLIPRHRRVKDYFADRLAGRSRHGAYKLAAIF